LAKKLPKLHDIFLKKFLTLFFSIFLILGAIVYFWITEIYLSQLKTDLIHDINIVSLQLKNVQNINNLAKNVKKATKLRVTIINGDGKVIGESDKDYKSMDNHINRPEIIQAQKEKLGSSVRYSHTLSKKLLYVAKKFDIDNKIYFIRMARDIALINQQFFYLSLKLGLLFIIFMAIAFYISLKISSDLQIQTKNILEFLKSLTKQKRARAISSNYSYEFSKITKLLTGVSSSLSKKDKQKAKYTTKLKLSNRQKDDIISAISHEFKNPIAVISGYTQTLLEDLDIDKTILEKFLTKIYTNSIKLTTMIDRLRLSIKLEDGKQELKFSKCDISKLTSEIIDDLTISYKNRNIVLNTQSVILDIDETLFSIVLSNLIENALKYSSEDIVINITQHSIEIIDEGIGISEDEIAKITNKFYRVSNNSWNNSLGLGLSIVKNIVELHNFKLEITSKENYGSTFKIIL
jgi:signal transduction histidine kinase